MTDVTSKAPWIPEREIRFAVVIYGGVSLAIYINGVVQEMLHMVRSTSPLVCRLEGSEKVYRELACLVGDPQLTPSKVQSTEPGKAGLRPRELTSSGHEEPAEPRSRFIVDILSGTSAGGINAIFLAKALANGLSLDSLAEMWILDADMQYLLNDRKRKVPSFLMEEPPQALLNSRWIYMKLLAALQTMSQTKGLGALVGDLDLFSTTTDLIGLPIQMALTDKSVEELRYKNFFHFQRRGVPDDCRSKEGGGPEPDHFAQKMDPFLAFAARCTSSFPFAFEPMLLKDILEIVESPQFRDDYMLSADQAVPTLPKFGSGFGRVKGAGDWEQFCAAYPDEQAAVDGWQVPFAQRGFADGGYLDNKPFSYAIDTIMRRHATVPVNRKLIYIEPAPEAFSLNEKPGKATKNNGSDRPNAFENVLDALVTLPRYETIRQDLERVIEWNNNIARLRRVIDDVIGYIKGFDEEASKEELFRDWRASPSYRTYSRLRLSSCADQLGKRICTTLRYEPQSAQSEAVRAVVGQWREERFASEEDKERFLLLFDFDYVGRMIRFLRNNLQAGGSGGSSLPDLSRITAEFRREADRSPKLSLALVPSAYESWKQYLKFIVDPLFAASLNRSFGISPLELSASDVGRDARVRRLFGVSPNNEETKEADSLLLAGVPFQDLVGQIGEQVEAFYSSGGSATEGGTVSPASRRGKAGTILEYLIAELHPLFAGIDKVKQEHTSLNAREVFEIQDSLVFPMIFGTTLGEFETIDIFRISPQDTAAIRNTQQASECGSQLKGSQFAAFGGFLDQSWRYHDMLRGRLDGAERLITAVLPDADPETARVRENLIREAQEAIAADWQKFCDQLKSKM
jgi:patatin-related protein